MESMEADCARQESLDLRTWLGAIRKSRSLLPQEPDEIALSRALRRAFHLSGLTPDPIRLAFATDCAEDSYESLLDAGDFESAARALLAPGLEVEISKPDGKLIMHIRASGIGGTGTGTSSQRAAAILKAWFSCISTAVTPAFQVGGAFNQDLHISPRVQHPSSSRH